ncbi:reverse transcriptase domain-containing protein [Tanacetum coccineum]
MLKDFDKDPTEISKVVWKENETLPNFKERWVSESNAIPKVPELMKISSFMSSHKYPEQAKRFSDSISKTVDEMLKRVDDYLRSEEAFRNTELPKGEFQRKDPPVQWVQRNDRNQRSPYGNHRHRLEHKPAFRAQERHTSYVPPQRLNQEFHRPRKNKAVLTLDSLSSTPQEILATEHQLRLPQPATPTTASIAGGGGQQRKLKQLEIALESGKLNHLVKDMRQRGRMRKWNSGPQKAKVINMVQARDLSEEALVVEGYLVRRIHIDEGASIEVKPLGKIKLDVCFGGSGLCRRAIMKFTIIPAPSPFNIILGRPDLKQLRVIPSTIYGMMKFPNPWGIAMLVSQTPIVFVGISSDRERDFTRRFYSAQKYAKKNKDVFAWEPLNMTGVPKRIIKHSLNANPSVTPVSQKRGVFCSEKSKVVTKEVTEWLKAGIIRPVRYPTWISNPVLVKKGDGSWRMCIDFKNINATCPKDYYPLPEIDSKIESVMGFPLKCFLDAYKGYHQVQMAEEDEEKTAFYTDQAYVDDMVVKIKSEREMLADIMETFDNLRRINMKLNPKKCSFGVKEGKFLGYMVTSKGIRANPTKTKDIAEMQSPRTWWEMQSLAGKLAALNRFLSRSAEKSLPFFETLKDITKENKHDYRWTEKAEEAFQELKKNDPRPTRPYNPTLEGNIVHIPGGIKRSKRNYASLEKMALALRHASRRLRRYFEAHPIIVITDQPIKKILNKADTSGRLAQYSIELGEFNISYEPCSAFKGHILANFINEVPVGSETMVPRQTQYTIDHQKDGKEEWVLYTDGASSIKGQLCHSGDPHGSVQHASKSKVDGAQAIRQGSTTQKPQQGTSRKNTKLVGTRRKGWVDELPNVLWAHQTSLKTSNIETPYSLTFGSEAVIPAEIGMPTHRTMMIKEGEGNEEEMRLNLDLQMERREASAIREARYKMKMEQYYNKMVRPVSFKVGEYLYWNNKASRVENLGKLGPKWKNHIGGGSVYEWLIQARTMDN